VLAHLEPELVVEIPDAFWVRVLGRKAYVITTARAIWQYDFETGVLQLLREPDMYNGHEYCANFVFGAVDEWGAIGPATRLYVGSTNVKTSIMWFDVETKDEGGVSKSQIINKKVYGSWTAGTDPNGHYMWMFAPHASIPKFVSAGISSSSPFLWSACLGDLPDEDPGVPYDGTKQFREGRVDRWQAPAALYGWNGHGQIGYSCDQFRDYRTWEEAQQPIMEALASIVPAEDLQSTAQQLFMQRTRDRF